MASDPTNAEVYNRISASVSELESLEKIFLEMEIPREVSDEDKGLLSDYFGVDIKPEDTSVDIRFKCSEIFISRIPRISRAIMAPAPPAEMNPLFLEEENSGKINALPTSRIANMKVQVAKSQPNRKRRRQAIGKLRNNVPLPELSSNLMVSVILEPEVFLITGNYTKNCREMSQSAWNVGDQKGMKSVESVFTGALDSCFGNVNIDLIGAGREDCDVRMGGGGRPCCLRVKNASLWPKHMSAKELENLLNSKMSAEGVQIGNLAFVFGNKNVEDFVRKIGDLAERKGKIYQVIVLTKASQEIEEVNFKSLKEILNLTIEQSTPLRVLHRRADLIRKKAIRKIRLLNHTNLKPPTPEKNFYFLSQFELETDAGTYIKEFVSGDFGRSVPSLGDLISEEKVDCECSVVYLDVVGLQL